MMRLFRSLVLLLWVSAALGLAESKPNILFIAIDDLRPELGCYGSRVAHSPNIDKLASEGVLFTKAYCQQAICGPSRASLLTGLRPDASQVHSNHTAFRDYYPDLPTLPQHFKNQGYHTQSMGKIYHGVFNQGVSNSRGDMFGDPESWSVPTFRPGPRYYYTEEGITEAKQAYRRMYKPEASPLPDDWSKKLVFGPLTEAAPVSEGTLYDGQVADRAVETLGKLGKDRASPFFLAVGFIKPHSPYIAPTKYWDLIDPTGIALASNREFPTGAPKIALHDSGELRRYTDQPKKGEFSDENQRNIKHAYHACVAYIDAQVGRVLDALEANGLEKNTIVVLWSDHGYHLGEKNLWGKTTNFELDTRVVLMVRAPGQRGNGRKSEGLVELVDLYPTLAELAGIPVPEHCQGSSFIELLDRPDHAWKAGAFSQYTRGKKRGYSVTDGRYRYTEWLDPSTGVVGERELYDHARDHQEMKNLAGESGEEKRLEALLDGGEGWRGVRQRLPGFPHVQLAPIFGRGMVLQRNKPVPIWGWSVPDAEVSVSFAGQTRSATADPSGNWMVELDPMEASLEPRELKVGSKDSSTQTYDGILVGDVWICAGQSNMRWMLKQSEGGLEAVGRLTYPHLRLHDATGRVYPGGKKYPLALLRDVGTDNYYEPMGWRTSGDGSEETFSAVSWFFGRKLQTELKDVPIGLIHNAIGGVPMESYIPCEVLASDEKLKDLAGDWLNHDGFPRWCQERGALNLSAWLKHPVQPRPHHPFEPGFLYKAGMKPLVPMAVSGFLWYQGESNATESGAGTPAINPALNKHKFKTLIRSWRESWGDKTLPFYFVQLPGLNRDWPLFREVQSQVNDEVPHTGMAVTLDLGHPTDVHPRNKRPVGERLAMLALRDTYGRNEIVAEGPQVENISTGSAESVLSFRGRGLKSRDGNPIREFSVAGKDRVFHPAQAMLSGKNGLTLRSDRVDTIMAVRYAWANHPQVNLVGEGDLPVAPFRTDQWEVKSVAEQKLKATDDAAYATSFEEFKTGDLSEAHGWSAEKGHAEVTRKFASSGSQCLHINGGENHVAKLTLSESAASGSLVTFKAERWTSRKPWKFRVEASEDGVGGWKEVYNGDKTVVVGRPFRSTPRFSLPFNTSGLRFTSTAPASAGVLIDDVRIGLPIPMSVRGVATAQQVNPVLIGKKDNPVLQVLVEAKGNQDPKAMTELVISTAGTERVADLATVRVFFTGSSATFSTATTFGEESKPMERMTFKGKQPLEEGVNHFWVSYELNPSASIDRKVDSACLGGRAGGISIKPNISSPPGSQRIGVALRRRGQDNSSSYRIPGLATTNEGTLIAVYDNRYRDGGDLPGDIDVGMSRSTDGGQSWERMKVIMDMGNDSKWNYDGIGDPAVLVDRKTNTIWVAATWSHGNRSWNGSGPGMEPEETGQLMLVKSEDDGKTWSRPINITTQVKDPKWRFVLQGPGKGISLKDGTLVFPAQFRGENAEPVNGKPFSTLIYSKDGGETWKIGSGVKIDTTEAQLVELADGRIMINCRDNRGGSRSVYTTKDLGKTWQVHPSSRGALPEPVCMASLIRVEHEKHGNLLFFSNPPQARGRHHMTIKVSDDEGMSWPTERHTLIDARAAAYSCMTQVGEDHVGLFYESVGEIYFVRVPIEELMKPVAKKEQAKATGAPTRPNILFIVSEDNGPELGCYGDPYVRTPHLDKLADDGVRFEHAFVPYSVCSPSRACFLTGLYPHQNGQLGLATHKFSMFRDFPHMFSLLKNAGYRTGLIGKLHVNPADVFEKHIDYRKIRAANFGRRNIRDYADAAADFFKGGAAPFVLSINYPDAHLPLLRQQFGSPADPLDGEDVKPLPWVGADSPRLRENTANYYNCMARLDEGVGLLLEELAVSGKAGNTLVIYIGDHGAQFSRGKTSCYEAGLRIPMIVHWSGHMKGGQVRNELVSSLDLLPTMLVAAGTVVPEGLSGLPLQPLLAGGSGVPWRSHIVSIGTGGAPGIGCLHFSIRDKRFKLIINPPSGKPNLAAAKSIEAREGHFVAGTTRDEIAASSREIQEVYARYLDPPEFELYDLEADPNEFINLAERQEYIDRKSELLEQLAAWRKRTKSPFSDPAAIRSWTDEMSSVRQKYQGLGYRKDKNFRWNYLKYLAPK